MVHELRSTAARGALLTAIASLAFALASCDRGPTATPPSSVQQQAVAAGTCDSATHETTSLDGVYQFDLACALSYFEAAGCDFGLDPDGNGSVISSSILEDMHNDPVDCVRGYSCSGCTDADSLETAETCDELAAFSYFTANAWSDVQAACPVQDGGEDDGEDDGDAGCTLEGLEFPAEESTCALQFFSAMTCESCREVLDSRTCEDAINDPAACQVGNSCTGCEDGDARGNGVDCAEIEAYSYFGPAAAQRLYEHVQANPCDGECAPSCDGRLCGDDGCGGECGSCAQDETCGQDGQCTAGCEIEGVTFGESDLDCAFEFFETMDCVRCREVFDARICEDAINDADACQIGGICTGCTDSDTRADGVTCTEIATYSYFGGAAAQDLLAFAQADLSCGDPGLVVDGVPFTEAEAEAVVDVANNASEVQLDDEAGLDSRAAANIVAGRPFATVVELGDVPYVGATVLQALLTYSLTWLPPDQAPVALDVTTLADEVDQHGEQSQYYGQLVRVSRAIIGSEPYTTYGGATLFYIADPSVGAEEQLKVYVSADANIDMTFATIHDEIDVTGVFTSYNGTFQIKVDDPASHACSLVRSGLAFEDYLTVLAAWGSTEANPEGAVYVESNFGYSYMVPLPVFLDHPMWSGSPPGPPGDDGNEQDHGWNGAAQTALNGWLAAQ